MTEKTILVCLEESRRPARIALGGSLGAVEKATRALYPSKNWEAYVLVFQIWSPEWDSWIDLCEGDEIPDK
jgi:hypothetical protein